MAAHRTRLAIGLGAGALALALSGCAVGSETTTAGASDSDGSRSAKPKPHSQRSETATPRPTPTSPTGSAVPAAAASAPASSTPATTGAGKPLDRLLTAAEMPGLPEGSTWSELSTRRSEGRQPFGTCHKFAMTSIGAMSVVVREFEHGQGAQHKTAGHLVADFADERTAKRAFEVLKSWRGQCEEELADYDQRDVGALQVSDSGDDAGWYLLSYGPRPGGAAGESFYDAQGITRVGRRVAALEFRVVTPGYDNPRDEEPILEAVRAASAKLG